MDVLSKKVPIRSKAYYQYLRLITGLYKIIPPFSFFSSLIALCPVACTNRYREAMKFVKKGTVCEIGSDGLSPLAQLHRGTITLDISYTPGVMILASAAYLPFKDNAFATVVALDVIEHLPRSIRDLAIREMIRVARDRVILSTPLEDGKDFVGRQFAQRFNEWFIKRKGKDNPFAAEHIANIEPSPDELSMHGFRIIPFCNPKLRFTYQRLIWSFSFLPLYPLGVFISHVYYKINSSKDRGPPFWGGICVLDKQGGNFLVSADEK